jgi:TolB-like protein
MLALLGLCLVPVQAALPQPQVLVVAFESLSPQATPWIGRAVQQDLVADLSRLPGLSIISTDSPATSTTAALEMAKERQVQWVLFGNYQAAGSQIRFTAQLLDVNTGQSIGTFKSTDALRNLFALEDHLAAQVKTVLTSTASHPPTASSRETIAPTGPVQTGDYGPYGAYGLFDGSSLQRAIQSGNLGVPPAPALAGEAGYQDRYRYGVPGYPWYAPWYGYRYWYYPVRYYPIYNPPTPAPFKPRQTLPPSNVQGYFPVTLQSGN